MKYVKDVLLGATWLLIKENKAKKIKMKKVPCDRLASKNFFYLQFGKFAIEVVWRKLFVEQFPWNFSF